MVGGIAILVSACGGDGGVSSTPPPAPPRPTYTKIADMSGDRTLQTGGVKYTAANGAFTNGTVISFGSGSPTIAYTASSDSYTLTEPGGPTATFGPAQLVNPAPPGTLLQYITPNSSSPTDIFTIIGPSTGAITLSYVLLGSWMHIDSSTGTTVRLAVAGSPTLASDMPKTGSANYTVGVGGAAFLNGSVQSLNQTSTATFSANFGAGTVATTLNLASSTQTFGSFNGTGTIASSGPGFSGTLSGTNASGIFSGAFFGPQALEMGFTYVLNGDASNPTFSAVGGAGGAKQ